MENRARISGEIMTPMMASCCAGNTLPARFVKKTRIFNHLMPKTTNLQWPDSQAILVLEKDLELSVMGYHPRRLAIAIIGMATALVFADVSPSYAFSETKIPAPAVQPAPVTEAPKLQLEQPEDGTPGLSLTTPDDSSGGTELKIPGVGTIGKLPKLDFGLELLYGDDSAQGATAPLEEKNDDVLIRGKIRHRF